MALNIPRPMSAVFADECWRQKDGTEIKITMMETDHIEKCLYIIKSHPTLWRARYIPLLEAELKRRTTRHG